MELPEDLSDIRNASRTIISSMQSGSLCASNPVIGQKGFKD
jgi:hypothetical protein